MAWASERERRAALRGWVKWLPVLLSVFSVLFLDAWLNVRQWDDDYKLSSVTKDVELRKAQNYELSLKLAKYSDPAYLETIAVEMGLKKPEPNQLSKVFYDSSDLTSAVIAPVILASDKEPGVWGAWDRLWSKSEDVSVKALGYLLKNAPETGGATLPAENAPAPEAVSASPMDIAESEAVSETPSVPAPQPEAAPPLLLPADPAPMVSASVPAPLPEAAPPLTLPAPANAVLVPAVAAPPAALDIPKDTIADAMDSSVNDLLGTL